MLADKDRIFTNLYGMHDRSLKGAQSRGASFQCGCVQQVFAQRPGV